MRVDTISVLLDRYGQCVTLYRGGVEPGREVRAFLQPLREAGREQARPSPLGLRREEILGLKWDCVCFETRTLEIRSVRTAAGKFIVTKEPKTESSRRVLHIPDDLADTLRREQDRQAYYREQLGNTYHDTGYVFAHEDGRPFRPNHVSDLFVAFIRKNQLPPLTLHGLRHSFASIANAKGIPMYDIGKALGHSTPATTSKIYTHLLDPTHKDLLEKLWET